VSPKAISSETAEQNQMSSELAPIDPAALSWLEYWYPIASKGLLAGSLIAVVAGIAAIGFALLLFRSSNLRDQYSDWRTLVLEAQAKKAEADLVRAEADLSDADARLTDAQTEATHRNEQISSLKEDAAKLQERIATLETNAAAANAAVADAEARAIETQTKATQATETISSLKAEFTNAQERIATLEREVSAANAAIADADARMASAQAEAARATESVSALETNVAKAQDRVVMLEREAVAAAASVIDADARAAEALAERTQAQERTATLEKEDGAIKAAKNQADIRAANLELALQKLREPRTLDVEQQARITAALTPYAGQEYTVSVASGSEAENLLCAIDAALIGARWKRISGYRSITLETKCGTAGLSGSSGLNVRLSDKADTEHQWNMLMLVNTLRAEGVEVDGSIEPDDASPTAIEVTVGTKPY
jgi:predicted  nucleic acid-binding Zn-ribbon protein